MTSTDEIADFAADVEYGQLPEGVREAAKRRLLDTVGVGLRTREDRTVDAARRGLASDGPPDAGGCRLWGTSERAPAPRAAMVNGIAAASGNGPTFLSPTPAPVGGSIGAAVAAADATGSTGETAIAAIAAALEVHGECAWNAPLDGFHPATHTAVAAAAGAGRAMGLDTATMADAVGIAAARLALDVGDRADPVPTGSAAAAAIQACHLADGGVPGAATFSAPNGWHERLGAFDLDFDPGCERVRDAAVLPYDGHPYEQPAIEAAIGLASGTPIDPADIDAITVETFETAVPAVDPERVAAALVDRELAVHRGGRTDIEPIAESVTVTADEELTARRERGLVPARLTVESRDGATSETAVEGFEGHPATPASWGTVEEKFHAAVEGAYGRERRDAIIGTVRSFEAESAAELARLLN